MQRELQCAVPHLPASHSFFLQFITHQRPPHAPFCSPSTVTPFLHLSDSGVGTTTSSAVHIQFQLALLFPFQEVRLFSKLEGKTELNFIPSLRSFHYTFLFCMYT